MKHPININGRQYFYTHGISRGEFSDSRFTSFYIKTDPVKKRVVKRKFFLFGPIIKDEIVEVDTYINCFNVDIDLRVGSVINPEPLKQIEESYNKLLRIKKEDQIVI